MSTERDKQIEAALSAEFNEEQEPKAFTAHYEHPEAGYVGDGHLDAVMEGWFARARIAHEREQVLVARVTELEAALRGVIDYCQGMLEQRFDAESAESAAKAVESAAWSAAWSAEPVGWGIYSPEGRLCELRHVKPTQKNLDWWAANSSNGGTYTYALLYATPQAPKEPVAVPEWIPVSERLPDVPLGEAKEYIVCSDGGGVFAAQYLNAMRLEIDWSDDPEENDVFSGWHEAREHHEFDNWYTPLEGVLITHWMPLPAPPVPMEDAKGESK